MSKRPAPSSTPSTPAAAVAAHPSSSAPSEVPTVCGSDNDKGAPPLSLLACAPDLETVINSVMISHAVVPFFDGRGGVLCNGDRTLFLGEGAMGLWSVIADMLLEAVKKYTPQSETDLPKKTAEFNKYKQYIIGDHSFSQVSRIVGEDVDRDSDRFFTLVTLLSGAQLGALLIY